MLSDLRPTHGRYGVALVEIALVLPVFLAVLGGVTEFGRAVSVTQSLQDAARLGAHVAAMPAATEEDVRTAVGNYLQEQAGVESESVQVTITTAPATGHPQPASLEEARPKDVIRVEVRVPYERAGWLAARVVNGMILSGVREGRREAPRSPN